jgi:hypothetical protein
VTIGNSAGSAALPTRPRKLLEPYELEVPVDDVVEPAPF